MARLEIIEAPDPRLRIISNPVARVDDDLRQLMDDMLETMYAAPGIGLAAVQVGVAKQVIVIDICHGEEEDDKPSPRFFVNPELLWTSEELTTYKEGCLSVPEFYEEIDRPSQCRISYLDYQGKAHEEELDGILATCLQHEMDHLKGILFIDYISSLKRDMILKKLAKARRQKETA